ncbi:hypothetical protein TNCV_3191241 [Trichonephila clavipes]|nr:hypothetical protein TNCV_3191241 [Trichonephila clavipes]
MNSGRYSASELRTQQLPIRSNSLSDGFELITSKYQSLKGIVIIGLKEAGGANRRIALWVEAMRLLEDAGKNEWAVADFSDVMVAVDLRPQLIEVLNNQTCDHRYQPSDV